MEVDCGCTDAPAVREAPERLVETRPCPVTQRRRVAKLGLPLMFIEEQ